MDGHRCLWVRRLAVLRKKPMVSEFVPGEEEECKAYCAQKTRLRWS